MKKFGIALTIVLLATGTANAAPTSSDAAMADHRYIVGTWHCSVTVGPSKGTYITVWSNILGGRWLQQTMDQPPMQRSMMKSAGGPEAGFRATFLNGYDANWHEWIRFGALSTGQYFTMRMSSRPNGGWAWTYVSFFRNRKLPLRPDASLTKLSPMRYRIDGPTYPDEITRALVTEHHVCTKAK